jgi:hypothetical protein
VVVVVVVKLIGAAVGAARTSEVEVTAADDPKSWTYT